MAAQRSTSPTLVANTALTVTFPQYFATITVVNRHTTATLWIRTDGQTPVIGADDNYPVLPSQAQSFPNGILTQEPITRVISGTQVQIISDTACPITVYGT
jgi:hypothetical protein